MRQAPSGLASHHLHCLLNRCGRDIPLREDPGRLWQVLALTSFSAISIDLHKSFTVHFVWECIHSTVLVGAKHCSFSSLVCFIDIRPSPRPPIGRVSVQCGMGLLSQVDSPANIVPGGGGGSTGPHLYMKNICLQLLRSRTKPRTIGNPSKSNILNTLAAHQLITSGRPIDTSSALEQSHHHPPFSSQHLSAAVNQKPGQFLSVDI
jgi:hypothetical protein